MMVCTNEFKESGLYTNIIHTTYVHLTSSHPTQTIHTWTLNWIYHPRALMESPNIFLSSTAKPATQNSPWGGSLWEGNIICVTFPTSPQGLPLTGEAEHTNSTSNSVTSPFYVGWKPKRVREGGPWDCTKTALKIIWGSKNPWLFQTMAGTLLWLNTV